MRRTEVRQQEKDGVIAPSTPVDPTGEVSSSKENLDPGHHDSPARNWAFWTAIAGLSMMGILPSLEGTVVSTALPSIIDLLQGGNLYVWVVNGYFLTTTASQPIYGQLADLYGRKSLTVIAIALFMVGSAVSGASRSMPELIAARTLQGIGGGGVTMMIEVVVSDIVPLRERGTYLGIIMGICSIGSALGPIVGGLFVQHVSWRWVFWINLPVGGAACLLLLPGLRYSSIPIKATPKTSGSKIHQVDVLGNITLVLALVSILLALSYAGTSYPWASAKILAPLILGLLGLICWLMFEFSTLCHSTLGHTPSVPIRLCSNRTSVIIYLITFLQSLIVTWAAYFLPVYFQTVLASSPGRSGVQLLATLLPMMAFGAIGGAGVQVIGRYKPFHITGFALIILALGLFSLLDSQSSTALWVVFQVIFGIGNGLCLGTMLQAAQAPLPQSDIAAVTGFYAFVRSFGYIWGITVAGAVFNNKSNELAGSIITASPDVRSLLVSEGAYQHATKAFIDSLHSPLLRDQVLQVFSQSLRSSWQISMAFAGLGFLISFFEKEIPL